LLVHFVAVIAHYFVQFERIFVFIEESSWPYFLLLRVICCSFASTTFYKKNIRLKSVKCNNIFMVRHTLKSVKCNDHFFLRFTNYSFFHFGLFFFLTQLLDVFQELQLES
jgi:hypothetical protein